VSLRKCLNALAQSRLLRTRLIRFTCLAIILNLLLWPAPGMALKPIVDSSSVLAVGVGATVDSSVSTLRSLPVVLIPTGPMFLPVPLPGLLRSQLGVSSARELTIAERTDRVSAIAVSPHKYAGYVGDSVTFVAMGTDLEGQAAHGAKFTFESSDTAKLTIDEAGRATLLGPGMVIVTARAGAAIKTAPVLIRPNRRRMQTDQEWQADQDGLVASANVESGIGSALSSLGDRLAPTVYAQSGGQGADYGNAAPVGQVGTPPFAALEETRLGPVMPQTNFEVPISLVDLGGRGLATSLMAYYNSNTWGAYVDGLGATHYVFDPIQSWPSPGFSLGFGRIVLYSYAGPGYQYLLIDPNGTRHSLGVGPATGSATLQTTDGSHVVYVGGPMGGTVYYQDGTQMTIGLVNNRRLPTQITDSNGNYIQIAYKWETNFPAIAINYIVDTLGRVINFNYGEWPAPPGSTQLTSISTPAGSVTFGYQSVTMNYSFLNDL